MRGITAHVRMFHGHVMSFDQLKFVHKLCFLLKSCNCTYLDHLHVYNTQVFCIFTWSFGLSSFLPSWKNNLWQTGLVALNCPKVWICVCLMPYDGLASNARSIPVSDSLFTRLATDLLHPNQDKAVTDD